MYCLESSVIRVFVAAWNVGGKASSSSLNIEDWLSVSPPADSYVLGFQEIVPLNAGNVLGAEDNGPTAKWLSLICMTLNKFQDPGRGTSARSSLSLVGRMSTDMLETIISLDSDFDFEGSVLSRVLKIAAVSAAAGSAYVSDNAGGVHASDIIKVCGLKHALLSSTNPARSFIHNTIDEHLDMLFTACTAWNIGKLRS